MEKSSKLNNFTGCNKGTKAATTCNSGDKIHYVCIRSSVILANIFLFYLEFFELLLDFFYFGNLSVKSFALRITKNYFSVETQKIQFIAIISKEIWQVYIYFFDMPCSVYVSEELLVFVIGYTRSIWIMPHLFVNMFFSVKKLQIILLLGIDNNK